MKSKQLYAGKYYTLFENYYERGKVRLHVKIWEDANGPAPAGHIVHHIDHDPSNNDITNLECISQADHLKWHRSAEGRSRTKPVKNHQPHKDVAAFVCEYCEKSFEGPTRRGNRFCSANCKSKARYYSGVDNENRNCVRCGSAFVAHKHMGRTYCGRACQSAEHSEVMSSKPRQITTYDPITGICDPPGSMEHGYVRVTHDGRLMYAHQLAFLQMTGEIPKYVDHVNGVRDDNRWSNLRAATMRQNQWNRRGRVNSSTGIKGVSIDRMIKSKPYRAQITMNGKVKCLGRFATAEEAGQAYAAAAKELHGQFYRGART